jgi:hypothetical protein
LRKGGSIFRFDIPEGKNGNWWLYFSKFDVKKYRYAPLIPVSPGFCRPSILSYFPGKTR